MLVFERGALHLPQRQLARGEGGGVLPAPQSVDVLGHAHGGRLVRGDDQDGGLLPGCEGIDEVRLVNAAKAYHAGRAVAGAQGMAQGVKLLEAIEQGLVLSLFQILGSFAQAPL